MLVRVREANQVFVNLPVLMMMCNALSLCRPVGTRLRPVTQLDMLFGLDKMNESKQVTVTPGSLKESPLD